MVYTLSFTHTDRGVTIYLRDEFENPFEFGYHDCKV